MPNKWQTILDSNSSKASQIISLIAEKKLHRNDVVGVCYCQDSYRKEILEFIKLATYSSSFEKSAAMAFQLRLLGNKKYALKKNEESLSVYTNSIRYAPDNSEDLALAIANRSAVFFNMDNFENCLKDIDLALKKGYPKFLLYKLYSRQGQSYLKLGKYSKAVESFELAIEMLYHASSLSPEKSAQAVKDLEKVIASTKKKISSQSVSSDLQTTSDLPKVSHTSNPRFAYASSAVELRYNEERGRHVIATRDITFGDTLFVEKPFAMVVLPDHYEQNCHHCCDNLLRVIPCSTCIQVSYCSENCKEVSWNKYHKWECHGGLNVLQSIGIAHLGLRVVLAVGSLNEVKLAYEEADKTEMNNCRLYEKPQNYPAVYQLESHINDLSPDDFYQYALTTCLIIMYLENCTNYFDTISSDRKKSISVGKLSRQVPCDILLVGNLILRHIAQMVCNGQAVVQLQTENDQPDENGVVTEEQVRIATGIYPCTSMMNHSCDPNIVSSYYNDYIIIRACKTIQKGSEVFNCYGPHFRRMTRKRRRKLLLEQYFFECDCTACSDSELENLQSRFYALKCNLCKGPVVEDKDNVTTSFWYCLVCKSQANTKLALEKVRYADELFLKGISGMDNTPPRVVLGLLTNCLQERERYLFKHNIKIAETLDILAKTYAILRQYSTSCSYLIKSLPIIEDQYGDASIELAHELQKLTDVLLLDLKSMKNKTETFRKKHQNLTMYIQKAQAILLLHYGETNKGLLELQQKEQEAMLLNLS